jgi:anaphase-promoting complex subunit 6
MGVERPYVNQQLEAQKYLLKAQCFEASENKLSAIPCYVECLKKDPTCNEAFMKLTDCYLLSNNEKDQLMMQLTVSSEDSWIKQYYRERIREDVVYDKKISTQGNTNPSTGSPSKTDLNYILEGNFIKKTPFNNQNLEIEENNNYNNNEYNPKILKPENLFDLMNQKNNIDFLCIKAKNAHAKYDIHKAYEICVKAIKQDPLYFNIIPIYCACLLDLNYLGELYYCAHVKKFFFTNKIRKKTKNITQRKKNIFYSLTKISMSFKKYYFYNKTGGFLLKNKNFGFNNLNFRKKNIFFFKNQTDFFNILIVFFL